MDASEIGKWLRTQEIADERSLRIVVTHEVFRVEQYGVMLGTCSTVSELYYFVCGYDWGVSRWNIN